MILVKLLYGAMSLVHVTILVSMLILCIRDQINGVYDDESRHSGDGGESGPA